MELPEHTTHSFIIRAWLEETAVETAVETSNAKWRGHITHIPSNKRLYIENLDDIVAFIAPYLEAMGIRISNDQGGSMSSIFSFLRGREEPMDREPIATPAAEETMTATTAVITPNAAPEAESINNAVDSPALALQNMLKVLRDLLDEMLTPTAPPLPAHSVSATSVTELSLSIGNRRGTEQRGSFAVVALKGGRLDVVVRYQLWANSPGDVDSAMDALHAGLLAAKDDLWMRGILRLTAEETTLSEHISSINAWRKTADYRFLYEFHNEDSEGAKSLIAKIPIDMATDTEDESALVTDDMVRWDKETAPILSVRGDTTIRRLSVLAFVPGTGPGDNVTLTRLFDGATGLPTPFTTLADFVTAVTDPIAPVRHAQVTFLTLADFLAALTDAGDPITLGDWDANGMLDSYQASILDFSPPLHLTNVAERIELTYQGIAFNGDAVVYAQAKR